ncbi:hypothetical protein DdX_15225 [Ditylenchus destructor]|uniref:Uncharacterized protein n=1 Tax=Ditylenchus destructor TaxID=166010 RepID=A0AAD4MSU0_9BILA|nr:hypothetical protein DdX_15225 [Ditylenchus destructor]
MQWPWLDWAMPGKLSALGSGRVIRQSLRLGETRRLVPVSPTKIDSAGIYGFLKSGKSWMTKVAAKRRTFPSVLGVLMETILNVDTSIARLDETRRLVPVSPTKIYSAGIYQWSIPKSVIVRLI